MKNVGPTAKYLFCLPCFCTGRSVHLQHDLKRLGVLCPVCGAGYTDRLIHQLTGLYVR